MLIVKTKLDRSSIHGIGVFADEDIPKGTVVWKFHPGLDSHVRKEQIAMLEPATRLELENVGYTEPGEPSYLFLCRGNAAFVNHSATPNTKSDGDFEVAVRDIKRGEEITADYSDFEAESDDYVQMPNAQAHPTAAEREVERKKDSRI